MKEISKGNKCKSYRDSKKIVLPEAKNYSSPSNKADLKHIAISRELRPNSEMPGNDR